MFLTDFLHLLPVHFVLFFEYFLSSRLFSPYSTAFQSSFGRNSSENSFFYIFAQVRFGKWPLLSMQKSQKKKVKVASQKIEEFERNKLQKKAPFLLLLLQLAPKLDWKVRGFWEKRWNEGKHFFFEFWRILYSSVKISGRTVPKAPCVQKTCRLLFNSESLLRSLKNKRRTLRSKEQNVLLNSQSLYLLVLQTHHLERPVNVVPAVRSRSSSGASHVEHEHAPKCMLF